MNEYKEQLIKMVEIVEAQIALIILITGFTNIELSPQIEALKEAKKVLNDIKMEAE